MGSSGNWSLLFPFFRIYKEKDKKKEVKKS